MKYKNLLLVFFSFAMLAATAQKKTSDSAMVAKTLKELITLCRNVDFNDTKTVPKDKLNKIASYIIYKGDDEKRNWKDFANYADYLEKDRVDKMGLEISTTVSQADKYVITGFRTDTESEGKWYVLEVSYTQKRSTRNINFAFLKIKGRFGLGDID
jgi:hypothetical protein